MSDTKTCAIHQKNRAARYLTEQSPGHWVCTPGFECKAAGSGAGNDLRVQCTLHGKLRSLDCLQDDGTGKLICTPERRCKTAGATMPDYRDREKDRGGGADQLGPYGNGGMMGYDVNQYAAAYGAGGPYGGGAQYPQFPGAPYGAGAGQYAGYGGMPGMYPHYGAYHPMFAAGMQGMPPGMAWPYNALGDQQADGGQDRGAARSRSARRSRRRSRGSARKGHSRSGSGQRRRRRTRSPSHYEPSRQCSPSSSSSSGSRST